MTHDPDPDAVPEIEVVEGAEPAPRSPETERIEDDGEPLGANVA